MVDYVTITNLTATGRAQAKPENLQNVFITYNAEFSGPAGYELDFTIVNQQEIFGVPKSCFIDNGSNSSQLEVYVTNTDQFFVVPPFATGYFILNAAISSRLRFESAGPATDLVTITIYNYDVPPNVWYSYGTSSPTNITQSYGTMAEGADVATEIYKNPLYFGGIDRGTGEFRGVSVEADGSLNVNTSIAGTLDVNVTNASLDTVVTNIVTVQPNHGAFTDRSIANLTGVSQQLMPANANRRYVLIQNVSTNNVWVNLTGGVAAANVAGNILLSANGGSIELTGFVPTSQINIIGTLNDDVTAFEA